MASMRDIQRRRNSIASTQQITKAMKLVSTVKLQRTREKAEECKPYFNHMYATVTSMLARTGIVEHPYLKLYGGNQLHGFCDLLCAGDTVSAPLNISH